MNSIPEQNSQAKLTTIALIFICVFSLLFNGRLKSWSDQQTPFAADVAISYWYLPAAFIKHDFKAVQERNPWPGPPVLENCVPKYTYGMSVMYSPFFFMGHALAKARGEVLDGYSLSYAKSIHLGCIIYALLGLYFTSRILRRYFSDTVTALTILLVFFGTNLFNYSLVENERIHVALFFLISVFTWLTIKWHENRSYGISFAIGALLGLIAMIRPTDVAVCFFFLLYGVKNSSDIKTKLQVLFNKPLMPTLMAIGFFMLLLPQLLFWKELTGHYYPIFIFL